MRVLVLLNCSRLQAQNSPSIFFCAGLSRRSSRRCKARRLFSLKSNLCDFVCVTFSSKMCVTSPCMSDQMLPSARSHSCPKANVLLVFEAHLKDDLQRTVLEYWTVFCSFSFSEMLWQKFYICRHIYIQQLNAYDYQKHLILICFISVWKLTHFL